MSPSHKLSAKQAFCQHGPRSLKWVDHGHLEGLRLAVKDLFHLKGEKNTAGNPDWFETTEPAKETATSLCKLLEQGADFIGFTHTDELAFSLEGHNAFYGWVENPKCPDHFCGGSSMGSAAVVAAGLAEIALGTDTAGSVRVPASYCGLYGIRPSQGAVSAKGVIPLAPAFDTVGWFSQSAEHLQQVGQCLLPKSTAATFQRLYVIPELLALTDDHQTTQQALDQIAPFYTQIKYVNLPSSYNINELVNAFNVLRGQSVKLTYAEWLSTAPQLSPAIAGRFKTCLSVTLDEVKTAEKVKRQWQEALNNLLGEGATLALPTTPTTAPKMGEDIKTLRERLLQLSVIAGLAGIPQCHLPITYQQRGKLKKPAGISIIKHKGADLSLLDEATMMEKNHD